MFIWYLYIYISICLCIYLVHLARVFYRIDHGKIWSPVLKAAANGGKPPAGGSSPASKPRAPSEKRWKNRWIPIDFSMFPWIFPWIIQWIFPKHGAEPHGFPRILPRQIPWSCCFSSSQVVTVKPRVSCAAAHFFCPESLLRWGWIPKHRRWISECLINSFPNSSPNSSPSSLMWD